MKKITLKEIISYTKKYNFVYPSSEIYNGLKSIYDYGPNGNEIKKNIKRIWWETMTNLNNNVFGIDSAILMNSMVWKASGHTNNFDDIMIENKDSKKKYKVEEIINFYFLFLIKNGKIKKYYKNIKKTKYLIKNKKNENIKEYIIKKKINCPESRTSNWNNVQNYNLMLKTNLSFFKEYFIN